LNLNWEFLSTKLSYLSGNIGILPDIQNTVYIVIATLLIVLLLGVGAALYLTEYSTNQRIVGSLNTRRRRCPVFLTSFTVWWVC